MCLQRVQNPPGRPDLQIDVPPPTPSLWVRIATVALPTLIAASTFFFLPLVVAGALTGVVGIVSLVLALCLGGCAQRAHQAALSSSSFSSDNRRPVCRNPHRDPVSPAFSQMPSIPGSLLSEQINREASLGSLFPTPTLHQRYIPGHRRRSSQGRRETPLHQEDYKGSHSDYKSGFDLPAVHTFYGSVDPVVYDRSSSSGSRPSSLGQIPPIASQHPDRHAVGHRHQGGIQ